jgi:hypothetical protein
VIAAINSFQRSFDSFVIQRSTNLIDCRNRVRRAARIDILAQDPPRFANSVCAKSRNLYMPSRAEVNQLQRLDQRIEMFLMAIG